MVRLRYWIALSLLTLPSCGFLIDEFSQKASVGGIGAATLAISDSTSAPEFAKQNNIQVLILSDDGVAKWCLSETQTTAPELTSCAGGLGPDNGWFTVRPTSFVLSPTDGLKTTYLWVADSKNTVSPVASSDQITLDTVAPTVTMTSPTAARNVGILSYTYQWSGADLSGIKSYSYETFATSNCTGAPSSSGAGLPTATLTSTLLAGSNTVRIFATDLANNTSSGICSSLLNLQVIEFVANPDPEVETENVTVGGISYFVSTDGANGSELWRTDGTTAGTYMVKDIFPGTGSSNPVYLISAFGSVFFFADDNVHGVELWKSDGTAAGTSMVKDVNPTATLYPHFGPMAVMGTNIFYTFNDEVSGQELWKSDGTSAGTVLVKDLATGAMPSLPTALTSIGGTLFFEATDFLSFTGGELYKSDGTAAGTSMVKDINTAFAQSSYASGFTDLGGIAIFTAMTTDFGVWRSNGTSAGTTSLKIFTPTGTSNSNPQSLTKSGSLVFFTADQTPNGNELWKTDGTVGGTVMVKDIYSGTGASNASGLIDISGTIYFAANDGINGTELWKSDGTTVGTVLVKDICVGARGSIPRSLVKVGTQFYFVADDEVNGPELWKSDGTTAGTTLVRDIFVGASGSFPGSLRANGTLLFFNAQKNFNTPSLWVSDGTSAGTTEISSLEKISSGVVYSKPIIMNNKLLFTADGGYGADLVMADGTANNLSSIVKNVSWAQRGLLFGSNYIFAGNDDGVGVELWKTDGTAAGTVMIKDVTAGPLDSQPGEFTEVTSTSLFFAAASATTVSVWKTDGTTAGTTQMISYPHVGQHPQLLTASNGLLFYKMSDASGWELWKSNGTSAGTVIVKDIYAGGGSSDPVNFADNGGTLMFAAATAAAGKELWKSDGTNAGTVLVKDIKVGAGSSITNSYNPIVQVFGTNYYFVADDGTHGEELFKSDGTSAGTLLVKDIHVGATSSGVWSPAVNNGALYFFANDGVSGRDLWVTDGSPTGTLKVYDFYPGGTPTLSKLVSVGGRLLMNVSNNSIDEIWASDGTATGTYKLNDVFENLPVGIDCSLTAPMNGLIYFFGQGSHGFRELWSFRP